MEEDHVANHDVEPYEVWEICKHAFHKARREGINLLLHEI